METTKTHGPEAGELDADRGPDRTEDDGATDATAPGTAPETASPGAAPATSGEPQDLDEHDDVDEPETPGSADAPAGVVPGAAAVVGAALGLASLTGTWLGTVLAERRQLIGQINTSSGSPAQQIEQIYGAPWHTTAAVNGVCALVALVVLGAVLLAGRNAAPWVRAVAWGGLALGVLGLCVAAGTWFDLFGGLPSVAGTPVSSGG
ncbi:MULTISPECIES: hypothetical protein [unclassified Streptomyces]|uniref:hypothetical protein n=1 Tax=unclassified Streptomyces TaxID=2593676 RepID=UPI00036BD152|nr:MULTISPECIES: hypothetical protein [unclassified Streptomyces]MYX34221.1 hypothetical protein [Streptomyces sp. SID8377]